MRMRIVTSLFLSISILAGVGLPHGYSAVSADAETRLVTVDHGAVDPAVSPDGSQIAVSILGTIWTIPSGGGEARQITTDAGWSVIRGGRLMVNLLPMLNSFPMDQI
jgi:Uncharacterized protein related to the periplasmic component of the Tol biopolymer transport system